MADFLYEADSGGIRSKEGLPISNADIDDLLLRLSKTISADSQHDRIRQKAIALYDEYKRNNPEMKTRKYQTLTEFLEYEHRGLWNQLYPLIAQELRGRSREVIRRHLPIEDKREVWDKVALPQLTVVDEQRDYLNGLTTVEEYPGGIKRSKSLERKDRLRDPKVVPMAFISDIDTVYAFHEEPVGIAEVATAIWLQPLGGRKIPQHSRDTQEEEMARARELYQKHQKRLKDLRAAIVQENPTRAANDIEMELHKRLLLAPASEYAQAIAGQSGKVAVMATIARNSRYYDKVQQYPQRKLYPDLALSGESGVLYGDTIVYNRDTYKEPEIPVAIIKDNKELRRFFVVVNGQIVPKAIIYHEPATPKKPAFIVCILYEYDSVGRVVRCEERRNDVLTASIENRFDDHNQLLENTQIAYAPSGAPERKLVTTAVNKGDSVGFESTIYSLDRDGKQSLESDCPVQFSEYQPDHLLFSNARMLEDLFDSFDSRFYSSRQEKWNKRFGITDSSK